MTYLTKEDWKKNYVQKICDDKSFSEYFQEKKKICSDFIFLIQKIFKSLNNNASPKKILQRILYSSLIFFHKYILSSEISFCNLSFVEKLTIYCACIFLSFKVINKLIPLKTISSEFKPLFNEQKKIRYEIEDINKLITNKELEILISIQFQGNIDFIYNYLDLIKKYLTQIEIKNEIIKNIINLVNIKINEIILFPLYLYFTPFELLISILTLIKNESKLIYININDFIRMNNLDIDKNNLMECSLIINKIINQKKYLNENNNNIDKYKTTKENKEKINFNTISNIQTNN
jgi:hypothetical protein